MRKDAAIALVEEDLLQIHPEVARACVAIINYFSSVPRDALLRITFGALSTAAGYETKDQILPAVQYLTGARVGILEPSYYFFDQSGDDFPISSSSVSSACKDGRFFHPETGEEVKQFEKFIGLEFILAEDRNGNIIAEWAGEES